MISDHTKSSKRKQHILMQIIHRLLHCFGLQVVKTLPTMWETQGSNLEDPLETAMSTPVFLPGEFHGQRRLVGYSPWNCKESDMTEWLTFALLDNPVNEVAWIYKHVGKIFKFLANVSWNTDMDTDYIKITIQHENHYIIGKLTNDLLIQRVFKIRYCRRKIEIIHLPEIIHLNIYISQFWRLRSSCSRGWHIPCLMRACSWLPSASQKKWTSPLESLLLLWALIPSLRALSSWPNHLQKAQPPNAITLGVRISMHEF